MLGIFTGGSNDGPITDRDDIIQVLQTASTRDTLEFKPKFESRQEFVVRDASGRYIKVEPVGSDESNLVDTQNGSFIGNDEVEYGIEKLWPSDAMREILG